jgi:hypothetical protein
VLGEPLLRSVCATALAIAALEFKYRPDKDQWELLVRKAKRRLAALLKPLSSSCTLTALLVKANSLVQPPADEELDE